MSAVTTAAVALTWAEVQAIPPGPVRDRVAYEWRARVKERRVRRADDIEDALVARQEASLILAQIAPDPPSLVARRRRDAVAEADAWVDPRCKAVAS